MGQVQSDSCSSCLPSCHNTSGCDATQSLSMNGVPYIPECEVFYEGGPDAAQLVRGCEKNPGHLNFIPVYKLTMDHLPLGYQRDDVMNYLKLQINKTVKITVKYTSPNRPITYPNSDAPYPYSNIKGSKCAVRCGTGVFMLGPVEKNGRCPCHQCRTSGDPKTKFLLGMVSTAAHVIFDDAEARCSTFELFYDSEDSIDKVKRLDGIELFKDHVSDKREEWNDEGNGGVGNDDDDDAICDIRNSMDEDEKKLLSKRCHQDRMWVLCATHELDLLQMMAEKNKNAHSRNRRALPRKYGAIISHPHGLSKKISFGHILQHRYPLSPNKPIDVPYVFGKGVMCRISERCQCLKSSCEIVESLQDLQQFLKPDVVQCKLGVEYKLKYDISILPPPDAIFLSESVFQKGCANYWVRFHPGTKFALQVGGEDLSYFVLQNAEFNFFEADFHFYTGLSYATYDINTCPGSSGATVLFTEIKEFHGQHSGALGNRINRSALDFY